MPALTMGLCGRLSGILGGGLIGKILAVTFGDGNDVTLLLMAAMLTAIFKLGNCLSLLYMQIHLFKVFSVT